jgi:hypothetical protein
MTSPHNTRRRPRAMATRQALRLVETETILLTWDNAGLGQRTMQVRPRPPRTSTARAALLAVGLPPPIAAALRSRLQLLPEQETQP